MGAASKRPGSPADGCYPLAHVHGKTRMMSMRQLAIGLALAAAWRLATLARHPKPTPRRRLPIRPFRPAPPASPASASGLNRPSPTGRRSPIPTNRATSPSRCRSRPREQRHHRLDGREAPALHPADRGGQHQRPAAAATDPRPACRHGGARGQIQPFPLEVVLADAKEPWPLATCAMASRSTPRASRWCCSTAGATCARSASGSLLNGSAERPSGTRLAGRRSPRGPGCGRLDRPRCRSASS
jgi:hypothetical protein